MIQSVTLILAVVLFFIFGSINLYFHIKYRSQAEAVLDGLIQNNGHRSGPHQMMKEGIPPRGIQGNIPFLPDGRMSLKEEGMMPPPAEHEPELPPEKRRLSANLFSFQMLFPHDEFDLYDYFCIRLDSTGKKTEIVSDYRLRYDDTTYDPLANASYEDYAAGNDSGILDGIRWKTTPSDGGYLTACINMQNTIAMQNWLLTISSIMYILCIFIAYLLACLFSRWAIGPVKESLAEQRQFIADAGHELKTPIAVIGANIDVLEATLGDDKWLSYIKTENLRLGQLVKDLLYLAHSDSGRIKLEKRDFNFSEMVESVVLPFESIVFEQGKELETEISENIPIRADEKSLREVVTVLVDNALKNTDKGAKIRVTVSSSGSQRFLKVYNTGKGIRPDELEKIFLRFYRSDGSRARNTGGSGLGLSIAQAIVLNHGGTIRADSKYGEWAEFTVRLPER